MVKKWLVRAVMLVCWVLFWELCVFFLRYQRLQNQTPQALVLLLSVALVPALSIWALSSFVYGGIGGGLAGGLFGVFMADLLLCPYSGNDGTYFLVIVALAIIVGGLLGLFLNPRPRR